MPTSYTPLIIGIAGGSGSGKTTLANSILEAIGEDKIALLPHDAYYRDQRNKSLEERRLVNYDHPDSLETDLMIKHIQTLTRGEAIDLPVYDFKQQTRVAETVPIQPKPIILVEGILIFVEPKLRNLFSMKLFVDTDQDICFIRRLLRDVTERGRTVESVIDQYLRTVRPSFIEFVEPTKRFADVIIPVGGQNTVASDMVIARLKALLPD
ncbi:MAG TPA: uridine kinase [Anaerolineaceae bacterium]|jgi:uridine kinase|nr:uridine kinase [Anaerolineaceae bacterium]HQJ31761.1 uridine kinase [Anaerolineaceae bacterium]